MTEPQNKREIAPLIALAIVVLGAVGSVLVWPIDRIADAKRWVFNRERP